MNAIKLLGTGRHVPSRCLTNDDLSRMVDTSDQWIRERTGIVTRYLCGEGEGNTASALAAAKTAMDRAGVGPEDIGVCVAATFTPDHATPSLACELHQRLGLAETTPAFDVNAACTGFLHALETARCLLAAGHLRAPCALVVGSEVLSRITDFTDRSTCVLFGDGAAAAVIRLTDNAPYACVLGARGDAQILRSGGAGAADRFIHMDGQAVFRFAVEALPRCVRQVLDRAGLGLEDVDRFVFHQANQRIIDFAVKKLGVDPAKCAGNISRTGNTSAASIPLLLDDLMAAGDLRPGQRALCVGFGGGLTWAGALVEVGEPHHP